MIFSSQAPTRLLLYPHVTTRAQNIDEHRFRLSLMLLTAGGVDWPTKVNHSDPSYTETESPGFPELYAHRLPSGVTSSPANNGVREDQGRQPDCRDGW